jgi:hypothetical protein
MTMSANHQNLNISITTVQQLATQHFGITAQKVKQLQGEVDFNFSDCNVLQ